MIVHFRKRNLSAMYGHKLLALPLVLLLPPTDIAIAREDLLVTKAGYSTFEYSLKPGAHSGELAADREGQG